MNNMIAWWAKNRVAANLLMIGIFISGALSFLAMEREVWPTIPVNWVNISVAWPGAAPQEVEEQIVIRIEEAMGDLENVERLRSTASEGMAQIWIEANAKIDMAEFINEVKMRVDSVTALPRDIEPPQVRQIFSRNEIIRIAVHGNVSERELKRTAERIRDEIALLPGASIVELFGVRREEVSIELSEEAMRRYGLTFAEVAAAIRGSSVNLSSGTVRTETGDVMLRARNLADTAPEFENIVVRQTADGGVVRVGDVANVRDGFEDFELLATMNGEPAVLVQVMTTERMNIVQTSQSVRDWLEEARERMPPGVSLTLWWDESKVYFDRMETISNAGFYGLLLVFLVLILTLRPKVAMWVTIGIATAFAGAFIFLPAADVSLNLLSLFAFLLVLGVIVDDAIIVGENIHRQNMEGHDGLTAATLGTQLVAKPVIFAVLTTMVAFLPWLLLSGVEVQFTRHITIIVIAALSFSLVEALLILPAHLSGMKPRENLGRFGRVQKKIADGIITFADTRYRRLAAFAVERRYLMASIFLGIFILSIGLVSSSWLKFSFMPEVENEQVTVEVVLPDGTPYSRALDILEQLQTAQEQLEAEVNALGDGEGRLIENWYTRSRRDSVLAIVQLAPPEVREFSAEETADKLRAYIGDIPDAEEVNIVYTINNPGPDMQYSVSAQDLSTLQAAVEDLRTKLQSYGAVYDVRDSLLTSTDEIRMELKPGAEQLGLTLRDVSAQVRQAYFGEEVQRLPREGNDVKVMVRYPRDERRSLESLQDFRVRLTGGREVPLMSVVDLEVGPGLKRINRRERRRSAVISAELSDDVRSQISDDLEENFFPEWRQRHPGASTGVIGQAEGEQQFLQEVMSLYIVALFLMYTLIAIAFSSYWLPLLVMTAIPFAFMGAVYGHLIFGSAMALFSYFGIAAAAGVVVNDNLVLVDYINRLRERGMRARKAVVEAGVARFRPIILTSVTTFVGLMPMMLERSTQAEFLKPTVIALAFGVLVATFVTLALVPALYSIGLDARFILNKVKSVIRRVIGRARSVVPGE